MNTFTYSYPVKIYFGENVTEDSLLKELSKVGENVMLAYGGGSVKKNGIYDKMISILNKAGKNIIELAGIMPNPTYAKVQEGASLAKKESVDFILAVGGGSVIDCCKIISAQAKTDKDIWNMEFVEHTFPTEFIPMGTVVTAFGTGAEENNGAVITNEDLKIKAGVMGAYYNFAILDPTYMVTMPLHQVISGAFDSLSHCMETYMGYPRETNYSDEINEATQRNIIHNIRETLKNPSDLKVRSELVWDAAMAENGMLKLGKKTDFECHMLEHQLGAYTDCNHGDGLAVLHPHLYAHMIEEATSQFARLAVNVWGVNKEGKTEKELAEAFVESLAAFIKEIGMPTTLKEMGIEDADLRAIANSTVLTAGCAKKFTNDELYEVLVESK